MALQQPNTLSLNQMSMNATLCLTILEYSIITNIDFDHPDYFTSLEDVFNAFNDYAKQISKGLFIYGEDKELRRITSSAPIYYYGFDKETNDFVASNFFVQRLVQPSTFISVEKIWGNSISQLLVVTTS